MSFDYLRDRTSNPYHFRVKVIIVGDQAVGKSCLLLRFTDDRFEPTHVASVGVDFGTKLVTLDNPAHTRMKLQIWDTVGQETFRAVTRSYYRGSAACLLTYDVTQRTSFKSVRNWLRDARHIAGEHLVLCLVGNKVDSDMRVISREDGKRYAQSKGMLFFETSALTGYNVSECFHAVAKAVFDKIEQNEIVAEIPSSPNVVVEKRPLRRRRKYGEEGSKDVVVRSTRSSSVLGGLGGSSGASSGVVVGDLYFARGEGEVVDVVDEDLVLEPPGGSQQQQSAFSGGAGCCART